MQVLSTAPLLPRQVRCEMLRGAGRLPACFRVRSVHGTLVPTEPTSMQVLSTAPFLSTGRLVPTEPTSELASDLASDLANEPSSTMPLSLLTLVQVLVMGDEEVRVWGSLSESLSMCLSISLSECVSE